MVALTARLALAAVLAVGVMVILIATGSQIPVASAFAWMPGALVGTLLVAILGASPVPAPNLGDDGPRLFQLASILLTYLLWWAILFAALRPYMARQRERA